ncbi:MAG TPA: flagellar hook-basal body complex protein [Clostridiales bacterium]|nr:flagellar hook-basal body complex protein [Clostridiales bacterium]
MLRALFSGVSGLKAHQSKMDVIGNNIANVNTYGYKSQRVTFQDTFYQTLTASSDATAASGGGNAAQIGYGTVISTIDVLHTRGGYVSTGRATDLYISGEGYFVAQDNNGEECYTRVGNLNFDGSGNLVDGNMYFILGYPIARYTEAVGPTASTLNLNGDLSVDFGALNGSYFNGYKLVTVTDAAATTPAAEIDANQKTITVTSDAALTAAQLETALRNMTAAAGSNDLPQAIKNHLAAITVSGTDTVTENNAFKIAAAGGEPAHDVGDIIFATIPSKSAEITVNDVKITFGDVNGAYFNDYKIQTVYDSSAASAAEATVDVSRKVITITSNLSSIDAADLQNALQNMTAEVGTGVIPADIDLSQIAVDGSVASSLATGVASMKAINGADVSVETSCDTSHGLQRITIPGSLVDSDGDGLYDTEMSNVMELSGIAIGANGVITGEYDNNIIEIGQILLAGIPNPQALTLDGSSYLRADNNTGEINYYVPGEGVVGTLVSSGLENSNVDLANEFADMIMAQRGFQANSRIITVGDEMLEELVNLKR